MGRADRLRDLAWLQEITGIDRDNGRGRRTVARPRRELINIPTRVVRRAGAIWLRLPLPSSRLRRGGSWSPGPA
ncbi:hypothetical protein [Blastococcus sp. SYSU DS0973]